jgi:hypothetical protein
MAEIEAGGIPVLMLRADGVMNPDGVRSYDLLVPLAAEELTIERHAQTRTRYDREADEWRETYTAEEGEAARSSR